MLQHGIMETLTRPKFNYIHEANWEGLHILANHWKSDMDFHIGEIRFLKKLINKYFIWLIHEESVIATEKLLEELEQLKEEGNATLKLIDQHLHQIVKEIKFPLVHNDKAFQDEHTELEERIAAFMIHFRPLKHKAFDLVEDVLVEEKVKHLMAKTA